MDMPNDVLILGTSYTPDYDTKSAKTNVYKFNEIDEKLAKKTKNLPVYIEHDDRYVVGKVKDSFVDEKRFLNSFLHISGNRVVNEALIGGAISIDPLTNKRFYNGLSMGTKVALDTTSKPYTFVKNVEPQEISIVQTPDRPNAFIKDFWILPKYVEDKNEYIDEIVKRFDNYF